LRKKETRVCSSSTRTRERELQGLREKRKKGIVGPIGFRKKSINEHFAHRENGFERAIRKANR